VKILVLNLTRLGDQLQTSPVIAGLKEQHPGATITVCVDRNFAAVCHGIPGVDRVWEIDLDRIGHLLLGGTGEELRAAYAAVEATVGALRAERFDLALNYSSSRMSAVLMGMLGVPDTRGWMMTPDGHRLITQPWSRLFAACALVRRQAPFNLVDHYKRIAGVRGGPRRLAFTVSAEARVRATAMLRDVDPGRGPLVAMQLGASRDVRRWPVESFVALGRLLVARLGARLLLCGGNGERAIASEIAAALGPSATDVCGRTTIPELGALLERAHILVTGDTGPMHLAVAVGTPVVGLFFGPALPADTGPYAADDVCLHAEVACAPCDHNVTCLEPFCRERIVPDAVAAAVAARLAGDWEAIGAAAATWPGIGWYRTRFDDEGLFDLEPLGRAVSSARENVRRAYRALWKEFLDDGATRAAVPAQPAAAAQLRDLLRLATDGAAMARELAIRAAAPNGIADVGRLEADAKRLAAHEDAIVRFGAAHEPAALLTQTFCLEREAVAGDGVADLATGTVGLHVSLRHQVQRLIELLDTPEEESHARLA
jgi:ADP-heptose:LPS heptosyltransferase